MVFQNSRFEFCAICAAMLPIKKRANSLELLKMECFRC